MTELSLPDGSGTLSFSAAPGWPSEAPPSDSRSLIAALHVVADPRAPHGPGIAATIDWESTLAYRRWIWSLGFGVGEAMDTAQRGMGLDWDASKRLIAESAGEARLVGGRIVAGVSTDQLSEPDVELAAVIAAYEEQIEFVTGVGAEVVIMASRALAHAARDVDDYLTVYDRLLSQVTQPVLLHWLGEAFDPELGGYWGSRDLDLASASVLDIVRSNADRIDGVKVSLLDPAREIALRQQLPDGVKLYTGDDFNYVDLIAGDGTGYSHALLGIFDAIAAPMSAAMRALDAGDLTRYREILQPTTALARHIFSAPTYYYKTGLTFLAWLNGFQERFVMVGGLEWARSREHLVELVRLADAAGVLRSPELAAKRLSQFLSRADS